MNCLCCKNIAADEKKTYEFHVLEVQTLKVRDMQSEKRIQALGKYQDYAVCEECAKKQLEKNLSYKKTLLPGCILFGAIFLVGVATGLLCVTKFPAAGPVKFFALAAMICGALGIYENVRNAKRHRREFTAMSSDDAMEAAAWEVLLTHAPKKSEDSDLSYIPINKKTFKMKNGDLMNMYDLLPEIAIKAYDMIHGKA